MKSKKANISVTELQSIIRQWKSRKITDSTISKLLELYLGMTGYMKEDRTYPIENFYDIKLSLHFATTQALIEAVKKCRSFGFILNEDQKQIKGFYSPLWYNQNGEKQTNQEENPTDSTLNLPQAFAQTSAPNNIYNIYTKGDSSNEVLSPQGESTSTEDSSKKNITTEDSLAAAKEFFHLINETPVQKERIFTPLIDWFQQHEKLPRKEACDNLVLMVNDSLIPYFASQPHFLKANHTGRLAWLGNLLKSGHGQHLLNDAARNGRQKREQGAIENRINQRDNHPINEFEWTDPETKLRFYDDPDEGMVNIPEDALPRPSATAVWNVLSKNWNNCL